MGKIDRNWLISREFSGFATVEELREDNVAPRVQGVYAVLRESSEPPRFLGRSVGGHFKGKDPTVPIDTLQNSWIPDSGLLYIGKAGKSDSGQTIRRRLKQYLDFGSGKPVGHWGGRFIWQLEDSPQLRIAWRELSGIEPRSVESQLIAEFESQMGALPFANLVR